MRNEQQHTQTNTAMQGTCSHAAVVVQGFPHTRTSRHSDVLAAVLQPPSQHPSKKKLAGRGGTDLTREVTRIMIKS